MPSLVTIIYLSAADLSLTQGVLCAEHLTNLLTGQSWAFFMRTEPWNVGISMWEGKYLLHQVVKKEMYQENFRRLTYQNSSEDYKPSAGNLFASSKPSK